MDLLQLFDKHHAPLFRFAYRLTGSIADAEDIVQACFLELLRPHCHYDPQQAPLRTLVAQEAIEVARDAALPIAPARFWRGTVVRITDFICGQFLTESITGILPIELVLKPYSRASVPWLMGPSANSSDSFVQL